MNNSVAQKIHEHDVDSCKKWLCDDAPINVGQGFTYIINRFARLYQEHINHLKSKLIRDIMSAGSLLRRQQESSSEAEDNMQLGGGRLTAAEGIVAVDDIVTIEPNYNDPDILEHYIRSRLKFVKLIYQYTSCFSDALYKAYKEITGESLILDDLSEVREFYKSCTAFDSWTGHELCAYISHCDPKALKFHFREPKSTASYKTFSHLSENRPLRGERDPSESRYSWRGL